MTQTKERYYSILRLHRLDIGFQFESDAPHLAAAVDYLEEWQMERIASKVGDSLLEGGDYHLAVEYESEDFLKEAYEKHKEEIDNIIRDAFGEGET